MPPTEAAADRERLRALADALLEPTAGVPALAAALGELETLLARHAAFRVDPAMDLAAGRIQLDDGVAISPAQAAMCLRDIARTVAFLRGVNAAIRERLDAGADRVRVLYAGCGPYALLVVPLLVRPGAERLAVTLLEINGDAIDAVTRLVRSLGLGERVDAIVRADAATWRIPDHRRPDVIVSETMSVALRREPQVAIMRNLERQAPGATLVPASVRVDACLVHPGREIRVMPAGYAGPMPAPERERIELGTVFELSRARLAAWRDCRDAALPGGRIRLPDEIAPHHAARLFTRIRTYGAFGLAEYDSGLTMPVRFPRDVPCTPGASLAFQYRLGRDPRLVAAPAPSDLPNVPG